MTHQDELADTVNDLPVIDANAALQNGLNFVYGVAGIVAVIVIIVAGVMYITSLGKPEQTAKALRMIIYAAVGLVVVILAAVITNFLISALSG